MREAAETASRETRPFLLAAIDNFGATVYFEAFVAPQAVLQHEPLNTASGFLPHSHLPLFSQPQSQGQSMPFLPQSQTPVVSQPQVHGQATAATAASPVLFADTMAQEAEAATKAAIKPAKTILEIDNRHMVNIS